MTSAARRARALAALGGEDRLQAALDDLEALRLANPSGVLGKAEAQLQRKVFQERAEGKEVRRRDAGGLRKAFSSGSAGLSDETDQPAEEALVQHDAPAAVCASPEQWREWSESLATLDVPTRYAWIIDCYRTRVDDDAMLEALRRFHAARGYVCDPHTAVAVAGADELGYAPFGGSAATPRPVAILATAHPCKFQAAVTAALGDDAWTAYEASDAFPEAARALATRKEIAPLVLSKRDGETLHSAQLRWESVVRAVLEDPGGLHSVGGADEIAGSETPAQAPPCKVL